MREDRSFWARGFALIAGTILLVALIGWLRTREHDGRPRGSHWLSDLDIVPPDEISSDPSRILTLRNRQTLFLAAPASLVWKLDGGQRSFRFEYGFVPRAFLEGTTDGLDVVVELQDQGATLSLFHHSIKPLAQPADRGRQLGRVTLPPYRPGSRLTLRILPGESGNNAWDWLYLCSVQFRRDDRAGPAWQARATPDSSAAREPFRQLGFRAEKPIGRRPADSNS